jgi:uncharacterized CHY-type Zn-finger protein
MPFSEKTKLEAKRKSHFACVICHQPFVEVHHILPQADGGSDDLDNAAPLCGSCHDLFGANPVKRKQIREMRDFWSEICEKRPANPDLTNLNERLDSIRAQISETAAKMTTSVKFRGGYSPDLTYDFLDMVVMGNGPSVGTYICVNPTHSFNSAPDSGIGWIQLTGGPSVWL